MAAAVVLGAPAAALAAPAPQGSGLPDAGVLVVGGAPVADASWPSIVALVPVGGAPELSTFCAGHADRSHRRPDRRPLRRRRRRHGEAGRLDRGAARGGGPPGPRRAHRGLRDPRPPGLPRGGRRPRRGPAGALRAPRPPPSRPTPPPARRTPTRSAPARSPDGARRVRTPPLYPTRLVAAPVTIFASARCREMLGGAFHTGGALCAGRPEGGVDTCSGDSGGPLRDATGLVVGITSWGVGCGRPGLPGIYTRISAVATWVARAHGRSGRFAVARGIARPGPPRPRAGRPRPARGDDPAALPAARPGREHARGDRRPLGCPA